VKSVHRSCDAPLAARRAGLVVSRFVVVSLAALSLAGCASFSPDGGTVTAELPLLRETLVALVAAPLRLTVQEAVPGGVRLAGVHMRVDSAGGPPGAIRASVKFTETPLRPAVSRAEPLTLTAVGALAVNPAMLDPAETVTDGGTLTDGLPLERATLVELETTALIYTVQDDVAGGVRLAGVHERLETVGTVTGWMIVMVVPVPVTLMAPPLESGAERPAKERPDEELVVPVERRDGHRR